MGIALLLAFFVFQIITRAAGSPGRLTQKAFQGLQQQTADYMPVGDTPLARQVLTVLSLAEEGAPTNEHRHPEDAASKF